MIQNTPSVSFHEGFKVWLKIGFINFGGPAGQAVLMHRISFMVSLFPLSPLAGRGLG